MMTRYLTSIALCCALLAGCDGGPSTVAAVDPGVGGTGNTDEGIGGTGIGTVTGFGSIIINQTREFDVDVNTVLRIDGQPVSESEFVNAGLGLVVSYVVGPDVNADFTRGTLKSIDGNHVLRGPVTGINPLTVLGQTVVVGPDTVLRDAQGLALDAADLQVGDVVAISGFSNAGSPVRSTRLERENDRREWRLSGVASQVIDNTSFRIGAQLINLNGVAPEHCGDGLRDGDQVEVEIQGTPDYQTGAPIDTVLKVECKNEKLELPGNAGKPLPAEIEGIVTSVDSAASRFSIGGQQIRFSNATTFKKGAATDLAPGVLVEVEGAVTPATGILDAEKIEIKNGQNNGGDGNDNGDDNENVAGDEGASSSGDDSQSSNENGNESQSSTDDAESSDSQTTDNDNTDAAGNTDDTTSDSGDAESGAGDTGSSDSQVADNAGSDSADAGNASDATGDSTDAESSAGDTGSSDSQAADNAGSDSADAGNASDATGDSGDAESGAADTGSSDSQAADNAGSDSADAGNANDATSDSGSFPTSNDSFDSGGAASPNDNAQSSDGNGGNASSSDASNSKPPETVSSTGNDESGDGKDDAESEDRK